MQLDREAFIKRLDGMDVEEIRYKVDYGLFAHRKLDCAKAWLKNFDRSQDNIRVIDERPQTVNVFFILSNKIKPLKWLLSKLGIESKQTNLIEHQ